MKKLLFILLITAIIPRWVFSQEAPPSGLKPIGAQFYIHLPDSALWWNKGIPYNWNRIAKYKDVQAITTGYARKDSTYNINKNGFDILDKAAFRANLGVGTGTFSGTAPIVYNSGTGNISLSQTISQQETFNAAVTDAIKIDRATGNAGGIGIYNSGTVRLRMLVGTDGNSYIQAYSSAGASLGHGIDFDGTTGNASFIKKPTFTTSTTATAALNIPQGATPTTPVNGDKWITTTGEFTQINGSTRQTMNLNENQTPINKTISVVNNSIVGTTNRAAQFNVTTGNLEPSATVDNTELGYLDGVTSAIQTQINGKVSTTRTISVGYGLTGGGDLSANRTITADTTLLVSKTFSGRYVTTNSSASLNSATLTNGATFTNTPTTSSVGGFQVLTRNSTTGVVETVAGTYFATPTQVVEIAGTTQQASVNAIYIPHNSSVTNITLPVTSVIGSLVQVIGEGSGGWAILQNASQVIKGVGISTTVGTGGSLSSTDRYCTVSLRLIAANTWSVTSNQGTLTPL